MSLTAWLLPPIISPQFKKSILLDLRVALDTTLHPFLPEIFFLVLFLPLWLFLFLCPSQANSFSTILLFSGAQDKNIAVTLWLFSHSLIYYFVTILSFPTTITIDQSLVTSSVNTLLKNLCSWNVLWYLSPLHHSNVFIGFSLSTRSSINCALLWPFCSSQITIYSLFPTHSYLCTFIIFLPLP